MPEKNFDDLEVGDIVCDMHDGEPSRVGGKRVEITDHVSVSFDGSSEILNTLLDKLPSHGRIQHPHNKYAVIMQINWCGEYVCGYSYDDSRLGMFKMRPVK